MGGQENDCVVKNDQTNSGGSCPWKDESYGVTCSYLPTCQLGKKNNCWGYTGCATGTCPVTAIGVFCIESGNSDNFKVCGCKDTPGSASLSCGIESQGRRSLKEFRGSEIVQAENDFSVLASHSTEERVDVMEAGLFAATSFAVLLISGFTVRTLIVKSGLK